MIRSVFDREDRSGLRNYFVVVLSFQENPVYKGYSCIKGIHSQEIILKARDIKGKSIQGKKIEGKER